MPDWENPVGYNKLIKISISNRLNFKIKYVSRRRLLHFVAVTFALYAPRKFRQLLHYIG